ncbi:MAG: hypothetical protein Q4F04_14315 [Paracoccus sp. (in: a-proteobacteria)]|nr:hypothetical protein [Paracoccus sp. (in: a-proteobacteria)]
MQVRQVIRRRGKKQLTICCLKQTQLYVPGRAIMERDGRIVARDCVKGQFLGNAVLVEVDAEHVVGNAVVLGEPTTNPATALGSYSVNLAMKWRSGTAEGSSDE